MNGFELGAVRRERLVLTSSDFCSDFKSCIFIFSWILKFLTDRFSGFTPTSFVIDILYFFIAIKAAKTTVTRSGYGRERLIDMSIIKMAWDSPHWFEKTYGQIDQNQIFRSLINKNKFKCNQRNIFIHFKNESICKFCYRWSPNDINLSEKQNYLSNKNSVWFITFIWKTLRSNRSKSNIPERNFPEQKKIQMQPTKQFHSFQKWIFIYRCNWVLRKMVGRLWIWEPVRETKLSTQNESNKMRAILFYS